MALSKMQVYTNGKTTMKQLRHFIKIDSHSKNMPYTVEYFDDQAIKRKGHDRWKKVQFGFRGDNFTDTGEVIDKKLAVAQLGRVRPDRVFSTDTREVAEQKKQWLLNEGWPKVRIKKIDNEDIQEASKDSKTFGT